MADFVSGFQGQELDRNYLAFFDCFNRQLFYEAHDVLEELWLKRRLSDDGDFYKALIQLAAAFVHLQKQRIQPATALFKLSNRNLEKYPAIHYYLNVQSVKELIGQWVQELESSNLATNPLTAGKIPALKLDF